MNPYTPIMPCAVCGQMMTLGQMRRIPRRRIGCPSCEYWLQAQDDLDEPREKRPAISRVTGRP